MDNNTVLVIGGTGNIGFRLISFLLNKGLEVYAVSKSNINKNVKQENNYQLDLINDQDAKKLSQLDVNYVINMVGYINSDCSYEHDWDIIQNHLLTTRNIIKYLNWNSILSFIQIGSSTEYGSYDNAIKETFPAFPSSPYGCAKLFSSTYTLMRSIQNFLPINVLRVFNSYGPTIDSGVIHYIIKKLLKNEQVTLNEPNNILDFIYIDDIVDCIYRSMFLEKKGQKFNLGSGKGYMLKDVVSIISTIFNELKIDLSSNIVYKEQKSKYINVADINKITSQLKWKPKFELENGLKKTIISYCKS